VGNKADKGKMSEKATGAGLGYNGNADLSYARDPFMRGLKKGKDKDWPMAGTEKMSYGGKRAAASNAGNDSLQGPTGRRVKCSSRNG